MKKGQTMDVATVDILRAAFLHTPDLAYVIDKHGTFIDCNLHFLTFLGLSSVAEKKPGTLYTLLMRSGCWSETQIEVIKSKDIEAIISGHPVIDEPGLPVIDHQGQHHHFLVSRIPLLDDNQIVVALLVLLKDVTKERLMQEQLDKMNAQLQQMNTKTGQSTHTSAGIPTPLKVLVVEDNAIAQKAAQTVLTQANCVVDVVGTEDQLLTLFIPGQYDMVFMDIGMQGTSGYMLAKQIRAQEKGTNYHVPIIALTGYEADMLTSDCGYYQMEGAITKPLTITQARQLIQRYILKVDQPVIGLKLAIPPS